MAKKVVPTAWQSRIVGECEIAPDQLLAHPLNARRHPNAQRNALDASLGALGWIQRIVVNRHPGHGEGDRDVDERAAPPHVRRLRTGGEAAADLPRCGERLRRTGRFDPERMEIVVSDDGVPEWRWKRSRERGRAE